MKAPEQSMLKRERRDDMNPESGLYLPWIGCLAEFKFSLSPLGLS